MPETPTLPGTDRELPPSLEQAMGRAMRIDQAVREFREQRARNRGNGPSVIAYTGYGSTEWVRVLARVLISPLPGRRAGHDSWRGWRSFTGVPVNAATVVARTGATEQRFTTDLGGVLDVRLDVALTPGWHTVHLRVEDPMADPHEVAAPVFVLDPDAPFGIVSDIDDTVMVTALPRPLVAAWNTFVLDEHARTPTPGMAVLYDRLRRAHPEAPFIYLSTGAWNVAPTLRRFLSRNLYPLGPLLLTDWGPTPDRVFRSGRLHKRAQLARLAEEFPGMRWLLIGDDGQHDEDTYGRFAEAHPENVEAVCIRQLAPAESVLAGGRSHEMHPAGADAPWHYAPDGKGMVEHLVAQGVLPEA